MPISTSDCTVDLDRYGENYDRIDWGNHQENTIDSEDRTSDDTE